MKEEGINIDYKSLKNICLLNLEKQALVFTEGIKKGKTYSLAKKN